MKSYDVIIIGGGPAGTSAALLLAKKGYQVALLEQARFPRDKVCGEFISPAADAIFSELGVLEAIESLDPLRLKGVVVSAYEQSVFQADYPPASEAGSQMTSLSVERMVLDHLMLDRVRQSPVEVKEGFKVTDFLFDNGQVCGVSGRDESKTKFQLKARVVVDAGGRNSISLRRLNLKSDSGRNGKIAFAAHWEGVRLPANYCYMHISRPGYTGIAPTGEGRVNVVLVADRKCPSATGVDAFYLQTVLGNSLRREMLCGGEPVEKVRTVDSLSYSVRPPQCGGLLLVGDATGFVDPFTGEGIYLSLRSSQLAARMIVRALDASDFSADWLANYDRIRRQEFYKKILLSKILQRLIYTPPLCTRVVKTLAKRRELAALLVGVIGDYVPAGQVVSFGYLMRLLSGWSFGGNVPSPSDSVAPQPRVSRLEN